MNRPNRKYPPMAVKKPPKEVVPPKPPLLPAAPAAPAAPIVTVMTDVPSVAARKTPSAYSPAPPPEPTTTGRRVAAATTATATDNPDLGVELLGVRREVIGTSRGEDRALRRGHHAAEGGELGGNEGRAPEPRRYSRC